MGQLCSKHGAPSPSSVPVYSGINPMPEILPVPPEIPAVPFLLPVVAGLPGSRKFVSQIPNGRKEIEWEIKKPNQLVRVGKDSEDPDSIFGDFMVGIAFETDDKEIPSSEWMLYFTTVSEDNLINCCLFLIKSQVPNLYANLNVDRVIVSKTKHGTNIKLDCLLDNDDEDDYDEDNYDLYTPLNFETQEARGLKFPMTDTFRQAFLSTETDTFKLYFTLKYHTSEIQNQSWEVKGTELNTSFNQTLKKDLGELWQHREKNFPDAILVIAKDDKELKVHKCILAARSPVLAAMFHANMIEGVSGRVVIEDISCTVMEVVLEYIYTRNLPSVMTLCLNGPEDTWIPHLQELINAAEKYDLPELKQFCDENVILICNIDNAKELLKLSRVFQLEQATGAVKTYIKENFDAII